MAPSVKVDLERAHAALELDIRLREIPPGARVRGVWFRVIADEIERRSAEVQVAFRSTAGDRSRWAFLLYDLREYLLEAATAGTLICPDDPREGVRTIWRNAAKYSKFMHPNTFLRLLRPDPMAALRWLVQNRDHFATFGVWRLEERSAEHAIVHMVDELVWIDTAQRGGAEGFLGACGATGEVEVEMLDRYRGRMHLRWSR